MTTTNRQRTAANRLQARLRSAVPESVTYDTGSNQLSLSCSTGRSTQEDVGDHGVIHMVETQEFVFAVAEMVQGDGDVAFKPDKGHVITWDGGTYEVRPVGVERKIYEYVDQFHVQMRVFTKQVA